MMETKRREGDQSATIIAAHYDGARQSINEWIKLRDQYVMLYMAGIGAIFSYYFTHTSHIFLLTVIPLVTISVMVAYYSADIHIDYLSSWLKEEYSKMISNYSEIYIGLDLNHWDASKTLKAFYETNSAKWRYRYLALVFILPNILTMILCGYYYYECGDDKIWLTLAFGLVVSVVSYWATHKAYEKRKKTATIGG